MEISIDIRVLGVFLILVAFLSSFLSLSTYQMFLQATNNPNNNYNIDYPDNFYNQSFVYLNESEYTSYTVYNISVTSVYLFAVINDSIYENLFDFQVNRLDNNSFSLDVWGLRSN